MLFFLNFPKNLQTKVRVRSVLLDPVNKITNILQAVEFAQNFALDVASKCADNKTFEMVEIGKCLVLHKVLDALKRCGNW